MIDTRRNTRERAFESRLAGCVCPEEQTHPVYQRSTGAVTSQSNKKKKTSYSGICNKAFCSKWVANCNLKRTSDKATVEVSTPEEDRMERLSAKRFPSPDIPDPRVPGTYEHDAYINLLLFNILFAYVQIKLLYTTSRGRANIRIANIVWKIWIANGDGRWWNFAGRDRSTTFLSSFLTPKRYSWRHGACLIIESNPLFSASQTENFAVEIAATLILY